MSLSMNNLLSYYPSMLDYTMEEQTNSLYVFYESQNHLFIDHFILDKTYSSNFRNPNMSFSLYTIQNTSHYNSVKEMIKKYSKWIETTIEARNIIRLYDNVDDYNENVSHDGYDSHGPVSDLWDLSITYKKDGKLMTDTYHRENWFNGFVDEYGLVSSSPSVS